MTLPTLQIALRQLFFNIYARNAPGPLQFVLCSTATCYSGKLDLHLLPSCFPWGLWFWVLTSGIVLRCTFQLATLVLCWSAPFKLLNFKLLWQIFNTNNGTAMYLFSCNGTAEFLDSFIIVVSFSLTFVQKVQLSTHKCLSSVLHADLEVF